MNDVHTWRPTAEQAAAALDWADRHGGYPMTLAAHIRALTTGIRDVLGEVNSGGPCSFWACPGEDHPVVAMATCNVCGPRMELRELLGDPAPECALLECDLCGKKSPWCDPCDSKLVHCEHAPHRSGAVAR